MSSSGSVGRTETRSRDVRLLTSSERTRALEDQVYGFAKRGGATVTWTQVAAFTACALVAIVTTAVITGTIVKTGLTTNNTGGSGMSLFCFIIIYFYFYFFCSFRSFVP